MGSTKSFIRGVTLGAGVMYLLDSERGQRRREQLSRGFSHLLSETRRTVESGRFEAGTTEVRQYGARSGDIEGLDGATLGYGEAATPAAGHGTALRLLGGLVALYGLTRRGTIARLLRTVGTGLLVGSVGRGGFPALPFPRSDRRRAVDIQKTLHIDAPVEQVYAFWSNYQNFPLFMSHVRDVEDLGAGRSHWRVSGPGGMPIEWNAVLTQQEQNDVIAWRSEPGSMLENVGIIRFVPVGSRTRVDLRFCYHPPAGGAGEAVAELLGSDPRTKLNEDLGRMKSLLEASHRRESHGQESRS